MIQLRPSQSELIKLKSPLGTLLEGTPSETMPRLRKLLAEKRPSLVVAVGDVVSRETAAAGIKVRLRIIDKKTLRQSAPPSPLQAQKTYTAINPAGVITMDAWNTIRKALREGSESVILVDGEEDLLTLPCIVESPDNAFVIYGQPSQGMVVVTTSPIMKEKVGSLLNQMPREEVPDQRLS